MSMYYTSKGEMQRQNTRGGKSIRRDQGTDKADRNGCVADDDESIYYGV